MVHSGSKHSGSKHWVKNTVGPNTKFLVIFFTMKKCYVMWEKKPGVESHAEKRKRIAIANTGGMAVRNFGDRIGDRIGWIFCFHAIFLAKCNMSQSSMCKQSI